MFVLVGSRRIARGKAPVPLPLRDRLEKVFRVRERDAKVLSVSVQSEVTFLRHMRGSGVRDSPFSYITNFAGSVSPDH